MCCNFTIKEMFDYGISFLKSNNIESPKINVEFLLCGVLNLSRIEIRLKYNETISTHQHKQFAETLERRSKHEPLQYIIGKTKFYNIDLNINKSVLIPRPETEELVKLVINEINTQQPLIHNILDIGTGSGCIALALAKEFPFIKIDGIDISKFTIDCANDNKNNLNIKNVVFTNIDFIEFQTTTKYDIIVSNPPYISSNDYNNLDAELFFEPRIALTDEDDGLSFYRMIADKSDKLLNTNGKIFLECGINQAQKITSIFNEYKYKSQIIKDFAEVDRFVIAIR
jgi:release factor glutamine methyltransferase